MKFEYEISFKEKKYWITQAPFYNNSKRKGENESISGTIMSLLLYNIWALTFDREYTGWSE